MNYLRQIKWSILWLFVPALAYAQATATFSYQRDSIYINRTNPPLAESLPWQEGEEQVADSSPLEIRVDIRSAESMYQQEGWVNMSGISARQGTLFVFETPKPAPIKPLSIYAPIDVIWIDKEGTITSIAPNLVLANMTEVMASRNPSKAMLFLGGGMSSHLSIAPGDKVIYPKFFTPAAPMLELPE